MNTRKSAGTWDQVLAGTVVGMLMASALFMASCDGGGGGGSSGTTIIGSVNSYVAGSSFFAPERHASRWAKAADRLASLLVPKALAGLSGVIVTVVGTDLTAVAGDDGSFVISGVPAGTQQLKFQYGDSTAYWSVEVPENATITLSGIEISGGSVNIADMNVEVNDNTSNENDNGAVDENANDNASTDDNANDNVYVDDNANDNVPVDDNANDNIIVDDNENDNVPVDDNANDNVPVDDNANDNV